MLDKLRHRLQTLILVKLIILILAKPSKKIMDDSIIWGEISNVKFHN